MGLSMGNCLNAFRNIRRGNWGGSCGAALEIFRLVSFTFIPIKDEEAPRFPTPPLLDNQNEDQPKTLDFALGELLGFELDFLFHQNVTAFPAGCQKLY